MRADQFIFKNLVYRPVVWLRGQNVFGHLRELQATQWLPPGDIARLQLERLQRLLKHARATSPAYARRLAGLPQNITSLQVLQDIPTLNKQELRNEHAALQSTQREPLLVKKTTGGSTGEPVTLHKTRSAMAWELAATWRGYEWAGVDAGDRQARFWGVPLDKSGRRKAQAIDFVCHRQRFSAFNFGRENFLEYERRLQGFAPDYFYGYVSMLAEFARWYASENRLCPVRPKAVITTSEVLSAGDRALIAERFSSKVFNEYGCGELGTIAHECEAGNLHLSDENMIVEILDGERSCRPGETGEIVVTELNNTAMYLIRYRTGDFGTLAEKPCSCGRTLRVLEQVFGRAYDFVVNPAGRKFHAELLMYVFEEAQRNGVGIAQFQVRQIDTGTLHVFAVPSPAGFTVEAERQLILRIQSLMGADMTVKIFRSERIDRERSGKMRVIVGLQTPTKTAPTAQDTAQV